MRGVDGHALTSAFFLPLLLRQTAPREQWQKGTAFCHPELTGMYAPPANAMWHNQRATIGSYRDFFSPRCRLRRENLVGGKVT